MIDMDFNEMFMDDYEDIPQQQEVAVSDKEPERFRTLRVVQERFFKMDEQSMFGIYIVKEIDNGGNIPLITNEKGEVTIKGETRKLKKGEEYRIELSDVEHNKRFGAQYTIHSFAPEKLETVYEQDVFMESITTSRQFKILKDAYPSTKLMDAIKDDLIDADKLNGIGEKTLEEIKSRILSNEHKSAFIFKLSEFNIQGKMIDKIIDFFGGDVRRAYDIVSENPYTLTKVKGIGFNTIDSCVKNVVGLLDSRRIQAALVYGITKAIDYDGHVYIPSNELVQNVQDLIPEVDRVTIKSSVEDNKDLVFDTVNGETVVGLRTMWEVEESIYLELKRIHENFTPRYSKELIMKGIAVIEEEQGFKFTEEQIDATVGSLSNGVNILTGGGGVGKSATIVAICKAIEDILYATCALSGKASNVLRQRKLMSSTLHRLLGYSEGMFLLDEENPMKFNIGIFDEISMVSLPLILSYLKAVPNGMGVVFVGDPNQLPAIGYGDMLRDLLYAKKQDENFFVQVHKLTVTHRQAEKSGTIQVANAVAKMEFKVDDKEPFNLYGDNQDLFIAYLENNFDIEELAIDIAKKFKQERLETPEDIYGIQFMSPRKGSGKFNPEKEFNTTRSMNIKLQQIFNPKPTESPKLVQGDFEYYEGDKIIAQGNSYDVTMYDSVETAIKANQKDTKIEVFNKSGEPMGMFSNKDLALEFSVSEAEAYRREYFQGEKTDVYNGTFGLISFVSEDYMVVSFEDKKGYIYFSKEDIASTLTLAYAVTIHKMQGSSAKYVVTTMDMSSYIMLSRQLVYTALTRTEVKHYFLTMAHVMDRALSKDASESRYTRLAHIALGKSELLLMEQREGKSLKVLEEPNNVTSTHSKVKQIEL